MKLSQYRGVIFDLDGVLIDSKDIHYKAFSEALLKVKGFLLAKTVHTEKFCGLPTIEKIRILQAENGFSQSDAVRIFDTKQEITKILIEKENFFRKDIYSLFENLSSRGLKIAVCSNTIRPTLDVILASLGIGRFLSLSLSSNDVTAPKPAPDIFIKAMSNLGIDAKQTLILEDSVPGIEAAKKSGADYLVIKTSLEVCDTVYRFLEIRNASVL